MNQNYCGEKHNDERTSFEVVYAIFAYDNNANDAV